MQPYVRLKKHRQIAGRSHVSNRFLNPPCIYSLSQSLSLLNVSNKTALDQAEEDATHLTSPLTDCSLPALSISAPYASPYMGAGASACCAVVSKKGASGPQPSQLQVQRVNGENIYTVVSRVYGRLKIETRFCRQLSDSASVMQGMKINPIFVSFASRNTIVREGI